MSDKKLPDKQQPQAITSIHQLLAQLGVKTRIYDLGRRITKLPNSDFEAFENGHKAYPHPYLHHAWLGLAFGTSGSQADAPETTQFSVWCLRFPLDEQGKLNPTARDKFLQMLLTAVGANLEAARDDKQLQAVLEGNPYVFTLPPERQAAFHAKIKTALRLAPSQFYQPAQTYLERLAANADTDTDNNDGWQTLGVQGLADIAVRWDRKDLHPLLLKALPHLPPEPFSSLCQCLENEAIDAKLAGIIIARIEACLANSEPDIQTLAAAIRGLSHSVARGLRRQALAQVLAHPSAADTEILAALTTRCAEDLAEPSLTLPFLEILAQHTQETFNRIMADLLFQPHLRQAFLSAFRTPERSEALSQAIGALLQTGG